MGHHHHHKRHDCYEKCAYVLPCPVFGPGGVGFWVFLLILALLGIAWAQGTAGPAATV
ncbi:MAG: hypothetical protein QME79_01420 [Bacillota bacterium]|nr:hypothetical protein [Bacillota bacterium]